ncbi:hypothetical protein HGM15179_000680 [Zosterops borbonicus]|uniref:Uncharacterized protein n=1 Tax=Zosterops borbonicus TaxID=364589 RepID=A0A8K1LUX6_9PASS|nr:hypothetical protein HGM15179_000680 [Zosterops borbonicus]
MRERNNDIPLDLDRLLRASLKVLKNHVITHAYFKEGITLLKLLEIFLSEDPFAFFHQLVYYTISIHHFAKAVENPFQLTQNPVSICAL